MNDLAQGTSSTRTAERRVDAHHHLWRYTAEDFGWLDDSMGALRRDFLIGDLKVEMAAAGVETAVAVQARCSIGETEFLLRCADEDACIAGVVGWLPLTQERLRSDLEYFAHAPKLCGVREIAQGQPTGFLLRPEFARGIAAVTSAGLAYDLLIYADQLPEAIEFADQHPETTILVDHASKPAIANRAIEPWRKDLRDLARRDNVACKISGLATEANRSTWSLADLRPFLDVCVESFGSQRLLAGSDWPVCVAATSYAHWWATLDAYLTNFTADERRDIYGGNAERLYRLQTHSRR